MASEIQVYLSKLTSGEIPHPGAGSTPEEIVASAKAAGFTFTVEDLASHADDDDLDQGGGGGCYFNTGCAPVIIPIIG